MSAAAQMLDPYAYWRNALAGDFGAVHDSDPQPGFYRRRLVRGGQFVPVAIWQDGGQMVAIVDGKPADASDIWTYVCQHPIPENWYRARMAGEPWPDGDNAVDASFSPPSAGGNNPPTDPAEILKGQIEAATKGVSDYAEIGDDITASRAQSLRARLNELGREADKTREAEKRPHFEAGKAVDAKYQPLVKAAKEAADRLARALGAHETRKARAAAEAEDARRKALAEVLAKHPEAPVPMPPTPTVSAAPIKGAYGRAASVKIVKITRVEDYAAAATYFINDPEHRTEIDRLAQRAVNAGFAVPGVVVTEERKVT